MVLHVGIALWLWDWVVDDAAITFGYAKNLLAGHGIVTYPQGPRVEGYSNPTYLALYAIFHSLGGTSAQWFAGLTSILFGLGAITILVRLLGRMDVPTVGIQALLTLAVLSPPWVFWMNSGLEGPLECLLLSVLLLAVMDSRLALLSVAAGLLVLTRPEGVLLVSGLACASFLLGHQREARHLLLAGFVVFGAATFFRLAYFGAWMPNTYFAKGTTLLAARTGIAYIVREIGVLPLAALVVACVVGFMTARRHTLPYLAAGLMAAQVAVVLKAGGDSMYGGRFLLPFVPGLVVGAGPFAATLRWGISDERPRLLLVKRGVALLAIVALLGLSAAPAVDSRENLTVPTVYIEALADEFGRLAQEFRIQAPTVMNPDLGGIMDRRLTVVDLGRLGDPVLAHAVPPTPTPPHAWYPEPVVGQYIIAHQRPDLVEVHGAWTAASQILHLASFHEAYSLLGPPVEDLDSGRFMAVSDEAAAIEPSRSREPKAEIFRVGGLSYVFVFLPLDQTRIQGNVSTTGGHQAYDLAGPRVSKQYGGNWSRAFLVARAHAEVMTVDLDGRQIERDYIEDLRPALRSAARIAGVGLAELGQDPELGPGMLAYAREHRRQGLAVPSLPEGAALDVRLYWPWLEGSPTPSQVRRYTQWLTSL